jgi:hypothetical protein
LIFKRLRGVWRIFFQFSGTHFDTLIKGYNFAVR